MGCLKHLHPLCLQHLVLTLTLVQVSIADLATGNAGRLGVEDAVPVRLKNAVLRILSHSLPTFRSAYLPTSASQQVCCVCHMQPSADAVQASAAPAHARLPDVRSHCGF